MAIHKVRDGKGFKYLDDKEFSDHQAEHSTGFTLFCLIDGAVSFFAAILLVDKFLPVVNGLSITVTLVVAVILYAITRKIVKAIFF